MPLSMMAVVAPRATSWPATLAPSSVTVQYLHTTPSANFSGHALPLLPY